MEIMNSHAHVNAISILYRLRLVRISHVEHYISIITYEQLCRLILSTICYSDPYALFINLYYNAL